jgi:hypothetical protein
MSWTTLIKNEFSLFENAESTTQRATISVVNLLCIYFLPHPVIMQSSIDFGAIVAASPIAPFGANINTLLT